MSNIWRNGLEKKKKNPRQQPAIDRQTTIDTDLEIECRVDIHSVDIGARGSHASTDIRPRRWKGRLVDGPCVSPIGIFPPVRRCAIRAGFIALPILSLAIEFGRWKRRFVDGAIFARVPVNPIGHEADHGESGQQKYRSGQKAKTRTAWKKPPHPVATRQVNNDRRIGGHGGSRKPVRHSSLSHFLSFRVSTNCERNRRGTKKTLVFTRRTHFTNFSRSMSVKCQSGLSSQVSYPAKRILFKKSKINFFFLALRFLFLKNSEKERQCRRGRIHATTDDSPPSYRTPDLRNKIQPLQ